MDKFALRFPLLCLIVEPTWPNLREVVESALAAGVDMLQLRGHQFPASRLYELACLLRRVCRDHGAAFLVNDRLDIGLASGADGFQLGTRSFPLAVARELVGEYALLGASVHTLAEARAAVAGGADFLLAGTIFASSSHPGATACGPGLLSALKREFPACPLLAIGGINCANAHLVMDAGADGIAVISAIFGAKDVSQAVHELRGILSSGCQKRLTFNALHRKEARL
ncbi:MAG TPA: thiamine phosphate synthase [Ktedonobacteraceae bacterium]|jgi:thiamine-phosphate diphosphorylase|nr:thiamine phosphate synthase [Ktedonobacteraceae bacterium]